MSKFCSPLRYPGGKSCIFSFMSNLFYENRIIGYNYAEPFAGGAGLALRLLFEEHVDKIYINDYDISIYSFWKVILNNTNEFCDWLEDVEISINNWLYYKNIQMIKNRVDEIELAKSTFFLNRTNVSGVIKGGVIGGINQTGKYKIDARFNRDDLLTRIKKIVEFKNRIIVSNDDGLKFVKKIDKKKGNIFIYLDPPYYKKGSELYMNFFVDNDHKKLFNCIKKIDSKWITSYDSTSFILNLYKNKDKVKYRLFQGTSNKKGDEIIIFPENVEYLESIKHLNNYEIIGNESLA